MTASRPEIVTYRDAERLPAQVVEMFQAELAEWRKASKTSDPRGSWDFACICAAGPTGDVLGGIWIEMGPVNDGPLAHERAAIIEHVLVRPEHRRQGIATALVTKAVELARESGCSHMRCNSSWDNSAEIALYKRCGFALADIGEEGDRHYFTVRPL